MKEAVEAQLKLVADNIVRGAMAIEEKATIAVTLQAMIDAIAGLMIAHAMLFDEVPPWGPEEMRSGIARMLREQHTTN